MLAANGGKGDRLFMKCRFVGQTVNERAISMIARFDSRTLADMEVALEHACRALSSGEEHAARRHIASKILKCARKGNVTLRAFTEAGQIAASELSQTHGV